MERNYQNFNRNKTQPFINANNKLLEVIKRKNLRDIEEILSQEYFQVLFY